MAATVASKASGKAERYLVVAASEADYGALRATAAREGARVHDLHGTRTLAVEATPAVASRLRSSDLTSTVARDHVAKLIDPQAGVVTHGQPEVTVAVADTGIDDTHLAVTTAWVQTGRGSMNPAKGVTGEPEPGNFGHNRRRCTEDHGQGKQPEEAAAAS